MVLKRILALAALLVGLGPSAQALTQTHSDGVPTPLLVKAVASSMPPGVLLSGEVTDWATVPAAPVHLNHTPPLYDTDQKDDGYRPTASMQLIRQDTSLYVRLTWSDDTVDSIPTAKRYADAGEPEVYKRQSEVIDQFRDAACLMVPQDTSSVSNPSLVMGDLGRPVTLYYWRNGEGFVLGTAAGRGSTTMSTTAFPGNASHHAGQWSVVFSIPMKSSALPLAFAIWDGSRDHRDGLKYYSLWYEASQ